MSLSEKMKDMVKEAMKAKDEVKKSILRLALAEIQKQEIDQNKTLEDASVCKILAKLIQNNEQTLSYGPNPVLVQEIEILKALIPTQWTTEQIMAALTEIEPQLKEAKNDGQATGVAMKFLKEKKAAVDGKVVGSIVAALRKL